MSFDSGHRAFPPFLKGGAGGISDRAEGLSDRTPFTQAASIGLVTNHAEISYSARQQDTAVASGNPPSPPFTKGGKLNQGVKLSDQLRDATPRISLHIDSLHLPGYAASDANRFADGLQQELRRLLSNGDFPTTAVQLDHLQLRRLRTLSGERPESAGRRLAGLLLDGIFAAGHAGDQQA